MKLFLPISLIIVSIILLVTIINPYYKDVSSYNEAISAYNLALDNSSNLQKTQDALIEKYKNIKQEDKDRLDHFLPNTINNIKFILEIEKIASLHNLQIKDINFRSDQQPSTDGTASGNTSTTLAGSSNVLYGIFPLTFTVDADYDTFLSFLKDLELNLRLIDVQSISFSVPAPVAKTVGGVDPNIYSYSLNVQTYWLK